MSNLIVQCLFTGYSKALQVLLIKAGKRRTSYLRPNSKKNLITQFKAFLIFCKYYGVNDSCLSADLICAYVEFLLNSFACPATVKNYISGLSTFQLWRGLPITAFKSFKLDQMWRSIALNIRYIPRGIFVLTSSHVKMLVMHSQGLGENFWAFKALISILFFAMVRISSCIPALGQEFDHSRHITGGDIRPTEFGFAVYIKWAKNLQQAGKGYWIPILKNSDPLICPVTALREYISRRGVVASSGPFFRSVSHHLHTLRIPEAYEWLRTVVRNSPLAAKRITFYSFRKGSCTAAFQNGASLADIRFFGAWSSDAVLTYLKKYPARVRVASALSNL